jgi:acetolactate synthase regulatory subunit
MPEGTPIACTLTPSELKNRLQWIASLMRDALRACERRGLELTLRFAPEAVERVRELVRREQACCGFLTFELHEAQNEIELTITAPEEARPAVNTIFGRFVG